MATLSTISHADVDDVQAAAELVVETHLRLSEWLRIGMTLDTIDQFVADTIGSLGGRSCFLGYRVPRLPPFPSHACLSVDDCVVHGHAGSQDNPLVEGQLLKIDIGIEFNGWIGDAAWTYAIGVPTPDAETLMQCGKEAIRRGIEQMQPGTMLINWARAVQDCVEKEQGLHLIRGYGGHGIGRTLHGAPFISNTLPTRPGEWADAFLTWEPGMVVAVEPMIATGTGQTYQEPGAWPIKTSDGSLSVHYEHDILITEDGPRILTAGLTEIEDVILRT